MRKIKLLCLICLTLLSGFVYAVTAKNIVVFGDSLSDSGNNSNIGVDPQVDIAQAPITNLDPDQASISTWPTHLVSRLYPNARILDWKTWNAETSPRNIKEANVDLAWASAKTGDGYLDDRSGTFKVNPDCTKPGVDPVDHSKNCVPNINTQIQLYFEKLGQSPSHETVFVIFAGSNDIIDALQHPDLTPEEIIGNSIGNLVQAVNKLENQGVSLANIVLFNLPDLAKTPFVASAGPQLQGALSLIVTAYNQSLSKAANSLGVMLYDDAAWMDKVLKDNNSRAIYGFKPEGAADSNCITEMNGENGVFYSGHFVSNCAVADAAGNRSYYFFVNGKHPTVYAQEKLAEDFFSEFSSFYSNN